MYSERPSSLYRTTEPLPNPRGGSHRGINAEVNPWVFHEKMRAYNLGRIETATGRDWVSTQQLSPRFPENSSGTSFMITIQNPADLNEVTRLCDLNPVELETFASFARDLFLVRPDGLIEFATYDDPKSGKGAKRCGQSVTNFHAHIIASTDGAEIPLVPTPDNPIPRKLRGERFGRQIEKIYAELMTHLPSAEGLTVLADLPKIYGDEKDMLLAQIGQYRNRGGMILKIPDSSQLAVALSQTDQAMRAAHRLLAGTFFANLDQVEASGWTERFVARSEEEVYTRIGQLSVSPDSRNFLVWATPRNLSSDSDHAQPAERPFRGVAFTTSLLMLPYGLLGQVVTPHFYLSSATSRSDLGIMRGPKVDAPGSAAEVTPQNIARAQRLYQEIDSLRKNGSES